jgi:hypothetical protein
MKPGMHGQDFVLDANAEKPWALANPPAKRPA